MAIGCSIPADQIFNDIINNWIIKNVNLEDYLINVRIIKRFIVKNKL